MSHKVEIISSVKELLRKNQHSLKNRTLMNPERDWLLGLGLALLVVLSGGVVNFYAYHQVTDVTTSEPVINTETVQYREESVAKVIDIYEARANAMAALEERLSLVQSIEETVATTTATSSAAATTSSQTATTTTADAAAQSDTSAVSSPRPESVVEENPSVEAIKRQSVVGDE